MAKVWKGYQRIVNERGQFEFVDLYDNEEVAALAEPVVGAAEPKKKSVFKK